MYLSLYFFVNSQINVYYFTNLRTNSFIFPLFNIESDVYSFRINLWAKRGYLQHLFDKLNMLAISDHISSYQNVSGDKNIWPEEIRRF